MTTDASIVHPVLPVRQNWALHDVAASRRIERAALGTVRPGGLMEHAGLSVARLARAVAPHARRIWIACGPGNNGGDGLVAARWLHRFGCEVQVTLAGAPERMPEDARHAYRLAVESRVPISSAALPAPPEADLCIDALLGIGADRAPRGQIAQAIELIDQCRTTVLAVDLPSGLAADTGAVLGRLAVRATHTLSLLTLKPGLFTQRGRDHAGRVWLSTLGVDGGSEPPRARLLGPPGRVRRLHATHKGNFGDLVVVGGATGMGGAALLAARAGLSAGAGRVWLARLDGGVDPDPVRPEVMPRRADDLLRPEVLRGATAVCGCGGGDAVRQVLPAILHHAARLVLDADALNAVAGDPGMRAALRSRRRRGLATVITPHPLEAARLLGLDSSAVQADRLEAAGRLCDDLQCTVVLKGSGTVVASPGELTAVNATGSARLASAGTGDVLAGWLGGLIAQQPAADAAFASACRAVWEHGQAAGDDAPAAPIRAADLIDAMVALTARC